MRMIFPCFSVSVVMNDPKLAGECRGLANQKMLADPVLTRLQLHGIVPNAGRSGQVVPGGLLKKLNYSAYNSSTVGSTYVRVWKRFAHCGAKRKQVTPASSLISLP